jgi:hypothetical protein
MTTMSTSNETTPATAEWESIALLFDFYIRELMAILEGPLLIVPVYVFYVKLIPFMLASATISEVSEPIF